MAPKTKEKCVIRECQNTIWARGYCRKHYGQFWRRGIVNEGLTKSEALNEVRPNLRNECEESRCAILRAIKINKKIYDYIVGWQNRLRIRRKIEELELELQKINGKTGDEINKTT